MHYLYIHGLLINRRRAGKDTASLNISEAQPLLTSLQQQDGQVDFTYAAEQTVHAVVSVRTSTMVSGQYNNPIMDFSMVIIQDSHAKMKGLGSGVIISQRMGILLPITML